MKKILFPAIILHCLFLPAIAQEPTGASKEVSFKGYRDIRTILLRPAKLGPLKTAGPAPASTAAPKTAQASPVIRVFNRDPSKDLSNVALEWQLLINGSPGPKSTIPVLFVGPRPFKDFHLPVKIPAGAGDEVFLNVRYRLKKQEPPLTAGMIIASGQLLLKEAHAGELTVTPKGELSYKDEEGLFTVSSPVANVSLQFNKQTGWLQQYALKGISLLDDTLGLRANFWRIPAGRERPDTLPPQPSAWKNSTKEPRLQLFSTSTASDLVIVRSDYMLPETFCDLHIRYTINARGEILVDQVIEVDTALNPGAKDSTDVLAEGRSANRDSPGLPLAKGPLLPRFGMQWILPPGFDSIAYYGRRPPENDSAQNDSAEVGIYGQRVRDSFPYGHPQDPWVLTAVRWWKIMDRQGRGISITADSSLLSMSAGHYFDSDGGGGQQTGDRKPRPQTQLNIDYGQMDLPYGNYHFMYKIGPLP